MPNTVFTFLSIYPNPNRKNVKLNQEKKLTQASFWILFLMSGGKFLTPISVVTATVGTVDGSMVRVGAMTGFLVMVAVALRGVVESTYNGIMNVLTSHWGEFSLTVTAHSSKMQLNGTIPYITFKC